MVYGYAVLFPHHNYTGALPVNADEAVIIGQRDLANLHTSIERAFAAWTGRSSILSPQRYQRLLNTLMPKFRLIRPLGPDVVEATQRIFELTDEQQVAFAGLYENHRVLIEHRFSRDG